MTELTALAKKLTTRKADGSLDVVGFDPFFGFFQNTPTVYAPLFGAQWQDAERQVHARAPTRNGRGC